MVAVGQGVLVDEQAMYPYRQVTRDEMNTRRLQWKFSRKA
jgi:hypothetical protein